MIPFCCRGLTQSDVLLSVVGCILREGVGEIQKSRRETKKNELKNSPSRSEPAPAVPATASAPRALHGFFEAVPLRSSWGGCLARGGGYRLSVGWKSIRGREQTKEIPDSHLTPTCLESAVGNTATESARPISGIGVDVSVSASCHPDEISETMDTVGMEIALASGGSQRHTPGEHKRTTDYKKTAVLCVHHCAWLRARISLRPVGEWNGLRTVILSVSLLRRRGRKPCQRSPMQVDGIDPATTYGDVPRVIFEAIPPLPRTRYFVSGTP